MADKVTVPVISAWASKINWTQVGAAATSLLVTLGIDIPAEAKVNVLTGLTILQGILTWVFRTWFTTSITEASAEKKS